MSPFDLKRVTETLAAHHYRYSSEAQLHKAIGGALAQRVEDGEAHVKRLAREFLDRHGEAQRATVTHLTPPAPTPQPEAP